MPSSCQTNLEPGGCPRGRTPLISAALVGLAVAAGCGPGPEIESRAQGVLDLDSLTFYPFQCNNEPAFDPPNDQPNGNDHRDVVGNPNEAEAALYYASDDTRLYLRMRVDGDPRTNTPTNLKSFGWAFLFDTEERDTPLPEYERLAHVNGTGGSDRVSLFDNTAPQEDLASDPSEEEPITYNDVVDRWVVDVACDAPASSTCFNNDDDFFITWATKWSDLEQAGPDFVTAPVVRGRPIFLWAGTTNSNNAIDADFACFDNQNGEPTLSIIPVNPPVVLTCGNDTIEGKRAATMATRSPTTDATSSVCSRTGRHARTTPRAPAESAIRGRTHVGADAATASSRETRDVTRGISIRAVSATSRA